MKQFLKTRLSRMGFRLLREPPGIVMGHDLWRDLGLLLVDCQSPLLVDVGANRGEITAAMLQLRPGGRVHAFEPSQSCQAKLQARFADNPQVILMECGLGDVEGTREFHRYANDQLSSFLLLQDGPRNPFANETEIANAPATLTTLDQHASRHGLTQIDLLKIDTQGYDLRVLVGAIGLLRAGAVNHVLVELNFIPLYENQPSPGEIISFLNGHGLQLVDFYEKCRRGQRLDWCTALFRKTGL